MADPLTLSLDIGGSGLKAGILDAAGAFASGPVRVATPPRATPDTLIAALVPLIADLGQFDRVSVGFPGVVRHGRTLTAANLNNDAWRDFPLTATLAERYARPVRMLNDATVQGLGVIGGTGIECVVTLGTGMGFALFDHGYPAPHLELSHHPLRKGLTYEENVGDAALREVGRRRWNIRLGFALGCIEKLVGYDTLYLGGGNARHIRLELAGNVRIVSNQAGITGGVRLWDAALDRMFAA